MQYKGWVIRLILGLALPVIIAAFILTMTGISYEKTLNVSQTFIIFVTFGYAFMFIPSLIFTASMEFVFNRKLKKDWQVLLAGTISGALSSLIFWKGTVNDLNIFQIVGPITGFICTWILRKHFKKHVLSASI